MSLSRPEAGQLWRAPRATLGELPRRGLTVSDQVRILELKKLFMDDPLLTSVVVTGASVSCITRTWFFHELVGPLGVGRGLYSHRPVSSLPRAQTLILSADTLIQDAVKAVLRRPELTRYDDVVVRFDRAGYSTCRVAELFAELAHAQAYTSLHDALTGLPNRRLFFDQLTEVHGRALARDSSFAVLFIDVDDFKTINDGLGHEVGDRALVETARRLAQLLEPGVTIARLGGDEFGMLIDASVTDVETNKVAERVAMLMGRPLELGGNRVPLSASVGVSIGPEGASPEELMRNADLAMYAVKRRQKGRYAFYEGTMGDQARETLELRAQLEGALDREEFRLALQPLVELDGQAIAGAEVLLRWQRPDSGLIEPARFIPLCEQTGMILPIGRWVLEESCRRAVAWHRAHPEHGSLRLNVNISARQLQEPDFVDDVTEILARTGMPAAGLVLEITESVMIEDLDAVVARLGALKALGLSIALDDFGTGFSSLSYLSRLPIDLVKLDRAFVSQLRGEADSGLLKGIVALARQLDLIVVAEGVEDADQVRELHRAGCHLAQGYYFARPMSSDHYEQLLRDAHRVSELPDLRPTAPGAVVVPPWREFAEAGGHREVHRARTAIG